MKNKLIVFMICIFFGNVNADVLKKSPDDELYVVDKKNSQDLRVSWPGGSTVAKGVLGEKGEITRDLVNFNGRKALHYENLASRTQFEAFVTLKRRDNELLVDCVYGNIRSEQNGALINKAVCGLDKKLLADYEQVIYKYSEIWKNEIAPTAMTSLIQTPSTSASIEEASIEDIKILRTYRTREDLQFNVPATMVVRNERSNSFESNVVFTVYQKSNLKKPSHLEVATENLESPFEKVDYKKLNEILK